MSIRIFRHYVSIPLLLLLLSEAAIFVGSVYLAGVLRTAEFRFVLTPGAGESSSTLPLAILYAVIVVGVLAIFGLYSLPLKMNDREYTVRFITSFPAAAGAVAVIFYALQVSALGRGIVLLSLLFSFVGSQLVRKVFYSCIGHEALKRRILVLGSGSRANEVATLHTALGKNCPFRLIGFLSCGDEQPQPVASPLIGDCRSLRDLVKQHRIDEIIVGVRDRRNGHLSMQDLLECKLDGISVLDLPAFFERETGVIPLEMLDKSWMVYAEGFHRNLRRQLVKRTFDVTMSIALLILTLPIMLIAAIGVFVETGRPVLYRQKRIGEHGRAFEILKFRSMRADAESDGVPRWTKENDARVTPFGRVLRMTHTDELPQLFNVLRGNMSLVGPRPERPSFVNELSRNVPVYASRHAMKPGLTGWAQIRHSYGASPEDAVRKLQFDLYYVKNHSLFLDLVILIQTAQFVLFGKGAR